MKKIIFLFFPLVLISIGSVVSGQKIKDQRTESLVCFEQIKKVLQHPGERGEPVPFAQSKFGQIVEKWIQTGASCPD